MSDFLDIDDSFLRYLESVDSYTSAEYALRSSDDSSFADFTDRITSSVSQVLDEKILNPGRPKGETPLPKESAQYRANDIEEVAKHLRWSALTVAPARTSEAARYHGTDAFILVRPEGYGKSALVGDLADGHSKVVFCCKTNEQLLEQMETLKTRFPHLKIERFVSRARRFTEMIESLGATGFRFVHAEPRSPYSTPHLDTPATLFSLRKALDSVGMQHVDHEALFKEEHNDYEPPRPNGRDVDVMMMTLAAFQGLCTSARKPWWELLGYSVGRKELFSKLGEPMLNRNGKPITAPVGPARLTVIIDDPDKTDFDWVRPLDADQSDALLHARRNRPVRFDEDPAYHLKTCKGIGPLAAQRMAELCTKRADEEAFIYKIKYFRGTYYEARPTERIIGYQLKRGYPRFSAAAPKLLITTTEYVTAKYAQLTLSQTVPSTRPIDGAELLDDNGKGRWDIPVRQKNFSPLKVSVDRKLRITDNCRVTLLTTKLVRRKNRPVLIPILEKLKAMYPAEDVTLIANGLGCELNLPNNRGRNDLSEKSTIIALGIPNLDAAKTLHAHFPASTAPTILNTIAMADALNQALGRNQGYRHRGKSAIVLIDPTYYWPLTRSGLLRYSVTRWSTAGEHVPVGPINSPLSYHFDKPSKLEQALCILLEHAFEFARSRDGHEAAMRASPEQQQIFDDWLQT